MEIGEVMGQGWLKNRKAAWTPKKSSGEWAKGSTHLFHHLLIIGLSVSIVLSLPLWVNYIAKKLLIYWSFIGNEKMFLASVEISLAILLILFSNYIGRNWKNKKLSAMARTSGLVLVTPARGILASRRIRKLKQKQGFARDVMVLSATGFKTFVEPRGELAQVIRHCREAKIMLLNPGCPKSGVWTKPILAPEISPEMFRERIFKSIDFLKELRAAQKNIRLKLYADSPFVKLTILGDYLWLQHYHPGLDVETLPKYVFKHDQNPGSLYVPFYHYFLEKWNCPDTPEYDLVTDELIYRDAGGNEFLREKLNRKDEPPGQGKSLALIQKKEVDPDYAFSREQQVSEDRGDDEDCLTEEVLENLSIQIHSRRN